MAGIGDDNELTQNENLDELTQVEILNKEHIADNTLTVHKNNMSLEQLYQEFKEERKANEKRAAEMDSRVKQSEGRINRIFNGLLNFKAEQKEAMKNCSENIGAISQQVQQSEHRIDQKIDDNAKHLEELTSEKFNALARKLDKMDPSEEASTVQFKSAFEQPGSFQEMTSVVSDLVTKRNKEVKLPSMDTPVKQKVEPSQYIARTQLMQNTPPASTISSIDHTTTKPESKADVLPPLSAKGSVLGPSALHNTVLFPQPHGKDMPKSVGTEQETYHMQGSLSLPSDKGHVPGPSVLHGTNTGMLTQPPFNGTEGASTEYISKQYTTPATDTSTLSYVGTPYVAQGTHVSSTPLHIQPAASSESHAASLVQNRPAMCTTMESMVQHTPFAFMTPVMTTVSSTDPSPKQIDTRRSRSRSIKEKKRSHSSSSDSSLDREYSRWHDNSGARDRSRGPQLPKMQIFTGRGSLNWEAFVNQFERTAGRRQWEDRKKVCRLLDCLADLALDVFWSNIIKVEKRFNG